MYILLKLIIIHKVILVYICYFYIALCMHMKLIIFTNLLLMYQQSLLATVCEAKQLLRRPLCWPR